MSLSENAILTLETIGPFLGRIQARVAGLSLPAELEGAFPRAALGTRVRSLRRRFREGVGAPLRIAFFGPTGAGKSKLFNSLAGRELSPSGYRRPFTRRAVHLVHETRRGLLGDGDDDVRVWSDPAFRDIVLVDTPDFDSVEAENRREADRILGEAEGVVFVTDAQKYADRSAWEYLERIFRETKPTVLLLNKATGDAAAGDFASRVDAAFGEKARAVPRIVVPEHPLDDVTPLPASEPALQRLREAVLGMGGTDARRRSTLRERLDRDYADALCLWAEADSTLRAYLEGVGRLEGRLADRFAAASSRLGADIEAEIDPSLKAEVYSRLLDRLQKIDVLRYPRKLLALPFRGLRTLVARWLPGREEKERTEPGAVIRNETFHALESILLSLSYETREDFRAERICAGILGEREFSEVRIGHGELEALYREADGKFRGWLRSAAEETASSLTGEHKLKFILSQVIFNAAMVGVQVHTAGGFTIAEALTDTVVSPLVAKAVGIAVSSEALGKFTRRARAEHGAILAGIVEEARRRFGAHLEARRAWEGDLGALGEDVALLGRSREGLVAAFERGAPLAPLAEEDAHEAGRPS